MDEWFTITATLLFCITVIGGHALASDRTTPQDIPEPQHTCEFNTGSDTVLAVVLRSGINCTYDGYRRRIPAFQVRTNQRGMREEPINTTPPPSTTRVLMLGDSFTFGWGVNRTDSYTVVLEELLNNNSQQQYQVINAGVPGYGARDMFHRLRLHGLGLHPDLVVVTFGPYDGMHAGIRQRFLREANATVPDDLPPQERQDRIDAYREQAIADWHANTTARLRSGNSSLLWYFRKIVRTARDAGARPVFYAQEMIGPRRRQPLMDWAQGQGVTLIWNDDRFRAHDSSEYTVAPWDGHYNKLGNRWLAEGLYDGLVQEDIIDQNASSTS